MITQKTTRKCLVGMVAFGLFVLAAPAFAIVTDSNVYADYSSRKQTLVNRERLIQKDCDDKQRRLDELQRRNDGNLSGQVNDLAKSLDNRFVDLRSVQQDIREVELKML